MHIQRETTHLLPVLLLEPDHENAVQLATRLAAAGFEVRVEASVHPALQALRESFFFVSIVVADLANRDCLAALDALRRTAPRSWMIVATACCDVSACDCIHRHGGDACVVLPISMDDLIDRLDAFQLRTRPSF